MLATTINSAIAGINALKDLGLAFVNERDRQKATAIQAEFTEKLISAQADLMQVLGAAIEQADALRAARERIRELEAKEREGQRYQLVEMVPDTGAFAYRLRPAAELDERRDEPVHFLCQPCFDSGIKTVLQRAPSGNAFSCPSVETHRVALPFRVPGTLTFERR